MSIGADHGDRGDWILLSGRDPSTFPSAISAYFFYIIKINKFCGCEQQPDGSINLQQASNSSSSAIFIINRPASFVIVI
jgi:hypothetical protein